MAKAYTVAVDVIRGDHFIWQEVVTPLPLRQIQAADSDHHHDRLRHRQTRTTIMIVFAIFLLPIPLNLDTVSLESARLDHGKLVVASFVAVKPAYTLRGVSMVGAADHDNFTERGVVLLGNRLDIKQGRRITVVGTLRVIRHGACVIEGTVVPEWYEIRVREK